MNKIEETVKEVVDLVPDKLKSNLVLIGSVNQLLQGVNVVPKKDIDLATNFSTLVELIQIFKGSLKRFSKNENGNDELPFAHLFIDVGGVEVEFFDAVNFGKSHYHGYVIPGNLVVINVEGIPLNALKLEAELEICQKVGKIDKAKAIEAFLAK